MSNRFKIYPDINFAISILEPGVKSFEEVYEIAKKFREDEDFSTVHYQLTEMRGCSFDFEMNKLLEMKTLIELYQDTDNQKLGVYIVDLPIETAYVHMFFELLDYKREYCSTLDKAFELLKLPISFEEFQKRIDI